MGLRETAFIMAGRFPSSDRGKRTLAALALSSALAGCGGGSPAAPAPLPPPTPVPTPPPIISFVDGITDAPLVPLTLTPSSPRVGDRVTVILGGYLTREHVWDGSPVALWPTEGNDQRAHWFHEVVYGGENEFALRRWRTMRNAVRLAQVDPKWSADVESVKAALQGVFWDVENAGGPAFTWTDDQLSSGLTVRIDPADPCLQPNYVSCARWWYDGHTVTRGELIFPTPGRARDDRNSMHSMGHLIGLNDWPQYYAVMNEWDPAKAFHEIERISIHMMYQHRSAGNRWPDQDAAFWASGARGVAEARR